jgi:hypothetical protein
VQVSEGVAKGDGSPHLSSNLDSHSNTVQAYSVIRYARTRAAGVARAPGCVREFRRYIEGAAHVLSNTGGLRIAFPGASRLGLPARLRRVSLGQRLPRAAPGYRAPTQASEFKALEKRPQMSHADGSEPSRTQVDPRGRRLTTHAQMPNDARSMVLAIRRGLDVWTIPLLRREPENPCRLLR